MNEDEKVTLVCKSGNRSVSFACAPAVLAVPHHYTSEQRQALAEAAAFIGMNVKDILEEPIAIATAHGLHRFKGQKWVLVCDFGHGAFQVSLLEISDDRMVVTEHAWDASCRLVRYLSIVVA